jgi:hypothetical protein
MKNFVLFIVASSLTSNVLAFDSSKLRIRISNHVSYSQYVCISQAGCININGASKKTLPLSSGEVSYIFLVEGNTQRMYPQTLPHSCQISVNQHQTLVISGKVKKAANDERFIDQLHCSVVNG